MILFARLVIAFCIGGGLAANELTVTDQMFWYVTIGGNTLVALISCKNFERGI